MRWLSSVSVLLLFAAAWSSSAVAEGQGVDMPREMAVERLAGNMALSDDLMRTPAPEEQTKLLNKWRDEFRAKANELFPEPVKSKSRATLETILASDLVIADNDDEYNELLVEEWARYLKINLLLAESSEDTWITARAERNEQLAALMDAVREKLVEHLGEEIAPEVIDKFLAARRDLMASSIREQTANRFGRAMSQREMASLLDQFESALQEKKSLLKAEGQETASHDGGILESSHAESEDEILYQLCQRTLTTWEYATKFTRLQPIQPETFDAEYTDVLKQRRRMGMMRKLIRDAEAARSKQIDGDHQPGLRELPAPEMLADLISTGVFDAPFPATVPDVFEVTGPDTAPAHAELDAQGEPGEPPEIMMEVKSAPGVEDNVGSDGQNTWKYLIMGAACFALAGFALSRFLRNGCGKERI